MSRRCVGKEQITRTHSSLEVADVMLEQGMVFHTAMSDPPPLDFLLVSIDLSCLNTLKHARFSSASLIQGMRFVSTRAIISYVDVTAFVDRSVNLVLKPLKF